MHAHARKQKQKQKQKQNQNVEERKQTTIPSKLHTACTRNLNNKFAYMHSITQGKGKGQRENKRVCVCVCGFFFGGV